MGGASHPPSRFHFICRGMATFWAWAFFLEGTADTLNAGPNFALHITDQNLVGTMGWLILTIYVPALVVTELLLGIHLVRYTFPQFFKKGKASLQPNTH